MMKFIKNFRKDEDGAVTVDWVVLTAAVVGLADAALLFNPDWCVRPDITHKHIHGFTKPRQLQLS